MSVYVWLSLFRIFLFFDDGENDAATLTISDYNGRIAFSAAKLSKLPIGKPAAMSRNTVVF